LGDCLSRMDRGESLMEILAVYQRQADKLKPLLLVAMLSRALPQPVPGYTALRIGKNELLAEIASMQADGSFLKPKPIEAPRERVVDRWVRSLNQLQPTYRFAMISLVVILAGGFFTFSASASGLADSVIQTLFYRFEQVGDLLLVKPDPVAASGDTTVLSSNYFLPDSPEDYSGDYKAYLFVDDEKGKHSEDPPGYQNQNQGETGLNKSAGTTDEDAAPDEVNTADELDEDLDKEQEEQENAKEKEEKDKEKEEKDKEKEEKDKVKEVKDKVNEKKVKEEKDKEKKDK